jgi:hypothetical protein
MRIVSLFGSVCLAVALSLAWAMPGAQAQTELAARTSKTKPAPVVRSGGTHVYLLRGWLDVFSTGMDDLTVKLNRRGIQATAHGHADYMTLADKIAADYARGVRERVVIIGHSLGANAAIDMAARLGQRRIPVPLVITYDPTQVMQAPANVSRLVNFYQSNNGWGTRVAPGPGFRGTLNNIDLAREADLGHTGIDKSSRLHMQSISFIQGIGGGAKSKTATPEEAKPAAGEKSHSSTNDGDRRQTVSH